MNATFFDSQLCGYINDATSDVKQDFRIVTWLCHLHFHGFGFELFSFICVINGFQLRELRLRTEVAGHTGAEIFLLQNIQSPGQLFCF